MTTDISVEEVELATAEEDVALLEDLIGNLEAARLAPLLRVVDIYSDIQAFIYVGDDNNQIQTKQDSDFACEGIILIGDDTSVGGSTSPHALSVEITPMDGRSLTQGLTTVSTNDLPSAFTTPYSPSSQLTPVYASTIPIDAFVPAFREGDTNLGWARNVDFWHVLSAEWLIPKGRVVNFFYRPDVPTGGVYTGTIDPPNPALVGYKVYT